MMPALTSLRFVSLVLVGATAFALSHVDKPSGALQVKLTSGC